MTKQTTVEQPLELLSSNIHTDALFNIGIGVCIFGAICATAGLAYFLTNRIINSTSIALDKTPNNTSIEAIPDSVDADSVTYETTSEYSEYDYTYGDWIESVRENIGDWVTEPALATFQSCVLITTSELNVSTGPLLFSGSVILYNTLQIESFDIISDLNSLIRSRVTSFSIIIQNYGVFNRSFEEFRVVLFELVNEYDIPRVIRVIEDLQSTIGLIRTELLYADWYLDMSRLPYREQLYSSMTAQVRTVEILWKIIEVLHIRSN